jgi:hypothetical protein
MPDAKAANPQLLGHAALTMMCMPRASCRYGCPTQIMPRCALPSAAGRLAPPPSPMQTHAAIALRSANYCAHVFSQRDGFRTFLMVAAHWLYRRQALSPWRHRPIRHQASARLPPAAWQG